jgi:SAM-dependent methyltransferase
MSQVQRCAWCAADLEQTGCQRLPGRVRCLACGVSTTDPWPDEEQLRDAYGAWYRPESGRFSGLGDAILRRTRGRLARRLHRIAPSGPVLDVGAGDGALLDALHATGRDAIGLERTSRRADIREADITEVDGEWAAIVFWHSLEHLPQAALALERAASLLRPGGIQVVAVPNSSSLQAQVFGDRWLAWDLPRHLVHLTSAALQSRLRELGLTVERASHWRGGQVVFGWLHGLVGTLPGHLDLYAAIRRPEARSESISRASRATTIAAGVALSPIAVVAAGAEIAARRGGTIYVEARRG